MSIAPSTFTPTPPADQAVEWLHRAGEEVAHAFWTRNVPGWMRSLCRQAPLTIALPDAPADMERCGECALLVDGAPGEIAEAYGR